MHADIHDGPEHTLQSEAGYIDARPLSARSTKASCNARPDHTFGSKPVSLGSRITIPPCSRQQTLRTVASNHVPKGRESARKKSAFSSPSSVVRERSRSRRHAARCNGRCAPRAAATRRYARESANAPLAPMRRRRPSPDPPAHHAPRARPRAADACRSIPGPSAWKDRAALGRAAARGRIDCLPGRGSSCSPSRPSSA
jgi:hypothetical protein